MLSSSNLVSAFVVAVVAVVSEVGFREHLQYYNTLYTIPFFFKCDFLWEAIQIVGGFEDVMITSCQSSISWFGFSERKFTQDPSF